jgi:hypothetical protein
LIFWLLLALVPAAGVAGMLVCVGGVASNATLDPTSTSGAVGDFTLSCSGGNSGSQTSLTFDYLLNAAVITPGPWILTDGVHDYSGALVAPNEVGFQNVPFTAPGNSNLTFTAENILVNPSLYPAGYQFEESFSISGSGSLPVSGGQQWVAMNGPLTLLNFPGGPSFAPVALPLGQLVGEVTGSIGGSVPQQYYSFSWSGGEFGATASVTGADSGSYVFSEGAAGSCSSGWTATLNSGDSFAGTIGNDYLAPGQYCIGLNANYADDPAFALTFNTPVTDQAPEPSGIALLPIGLGMVGLLRARKRRGENSRVSRACQPGSSK